MIAGSKLSAQHSCIQPAPTQRRLCFKRFLLSGKGHPAGTNTDARQRAENHGAATLQVLESKGVQARLGIGTSKWVKVLGAVTGSGHRRQYSRSAAVLVPLYQLSPKRLRPEVALACVLQSCGQSNEHSFSEYEEMLAPAWSHVHQRPGCRVQDTQHSPS